MNKILIINGSNINLLGFREPKVYGKKKFKNLCKKISKIFKKNIKITFFQSNNEHKIIKIIHKKKNIIDGIIINPAAFSYYNISILDAILSVNKPFIEIHISNIYKRELWRTKTIFSKYSIATITGMGLNGYIYAIHKILNLLKRKKN